jgi:hypothetical protein
MMRNDARRGDQQRGDQARAVGHRDDVAVTRGGDGDRRVVEAVDERDGVAGGVLIGAAVEIGQHRHEDHEPERDSEAPRKPDERAQIARREAYSGRGL